MLDYLSNKYMLLVMTHCGSGNYEEARKSNADALRLASDAHAVALIARCLPISAAIWTHEGQQTRAVALPGLAFTHPASATGWMENWPLLTRLRASLTAELGARAYQAAWERGSALDFDAAVQALLDEDKTR